MGFFNSVFFLLGVFVFLIPYLFIYARSVDEKCMVKKVDVRDLTEGDWLAESLKLGKKKILPNWEGLNRDEIALIRKNYKEVKVKYGIPFVPAFFIALSAFAYLFFNGLWGVFW